MVRRPATFRPVPFRRMWDTRARPRMHDKVRAVRFVVPLATGSGSCMYVFLFLTIHSSPEYCRPLGRSLRAVSNSDIYMCVCSRSRGAKMVLQVSPPPCCSPGIPHAPHRPISGHSHSIATTSTMYSLRAIEGDELNRYRAEGMSQSFHTSILYKPCDLMHPVGSSAGLENRNPNGQLWQAWASNPSTPSTTQVSITAPWKTADDMANTQPRRKLHHRARHTGGSSTRGPATPRPHRNLA